MTATKTTMTMTNIEAFQHLSNFKSLKDLNNNIEQILLDYKTAFTKSELIGLKHLLQFCAKVKGVATARICKLISATFKDGKVGISRRTFERMLKKAEELGILTIKNGERWNGSQTSNIYVFNRYETVKKHAEIQSNQASEVVEIVPESNTTGVPEQEKLTHLNTNNLLTQSGFRSSNPKHETPIYRESVENEASQLIKTAESIEQAEIYLTGFIDNPNQLQLFRMIHEYPFPEAIQKHSAVLSLRAGLHGTVTPKIKLKALQVLKKIALNMADGVVIDSVIDVFTYEMFNIGATPVMKATPEAPEASPAVKKVPFYNWLVERCTKNSTKTKPAAKKVATPAVEKVSADKADIEAMRNQLLIELGQA